jgi:hypothetical protein
MKLPKFLLIVLGIILPSLGSVFAQDALPTDDAGGETMPAVIACEWGELHVMPTPSESTEGTTSVSSGVVSATADPTTVPPVATEEATLEPEDGETIKVTIQANDSLYQEEDPCAAAEILLDMEAENSGLTVEEVESLALLSMPPRVTLIIRGTQPDACGIGYRFVERRNGADIGLWVDRVLAPDQLCAQAITPFEANYGLGTMQPGAYKITVNGYEFELAI